MDFGSSDPWKGALGVGDTLFFIKSAFPILPRSNYAKPFPRGPKIIHTLHPSPTKVLQLSIGQ